jgi:hypothetical protein
VVVSPLVEALCEPPPDLCKLAQTRGSSGDGRGKTVAVMGESVAGLCEPPPDLCELALVLGERAAAL